MAVLVTGGAGYASSLPVEPSCSQTGRRGFGQPPARAPGIAAGGGRFDQGNAGDAALVKCIATEYKIESCIAFP